MSNFHAYIDPGYYIGDASGLGDYCFYWLVPPDSRTTTYEKWVAWWNKSYVEVTFINEYKYKSLTVPVNTIQDVVFFSNWARHTSLSSFEVERVKEMLAKNTTPNEFWDFLLYAWKSKKPTSGAGYLEVAGKLLESLYRINTLG